MPYTINSKVNPAIAEREVELLRSGLTYTQIAEITGVRQDVVSYRNRTFYKIDIFDVFRDNIAKAGIPNKLSVSDEFGHWFSGFFDGEGTLVLFFRMRGKYPELRANIRIMLRDDDADVIHRIKNNLNLGCISFHKKNGKTNPAIAWQGDGIKNMAEIIVPLFEKYPLYTKKADEFIIWKKVIIQRYISTMGGYSNRKRVPDEEIRMFQKSINLLKKIRTY